MHIITNYLHFTRAYIDWIFGSEWGVFNKLSHNYNIFDANLQTAMLLF